MQIAHEMDWEDLTDHGSGSCVASHGCAGVTQSDLYEYGDRIRAAVLAESAPPSDLVALLREALEVLPGRGNLRRRIIQTIGESDAPPSAEPDAPPRDNKAMSGTRSETIAPSSGSLPNTSRPAEGATTLKEKHMKVTNEMVDRFLSWKLPQSFGPDGGITFTKTHNTYIDGQFVKDVPRKQDDPSWPVGTNLFTADEARAMLEHALADAPASPLLPGLELAAEVCAREYNERYNAGHAVCRGITLCESAIGAEISRLRAKGAKNGT